MTCEAEQDLTTLKADRKRSIFEHLLCASPLSQKPVSPQIHTEKNCAATNTDASPSRAQTTRQVLNSTDRLERLIEYCPKIVEHTVLTIELRAASHIYIFKKRLKKIGFDRYFSRTMDLIYFSCIYYTIYLSVFVIFFKPM